MPRRSALRRAARRLARRAALAALFALLALATLLWAFPPDLLKIGSAYTAKTVCSSVFLEGREPHEVFESDVQAPGSMLFRLMRVSVEQDSGRVRAAFLGFIGSSLAALRPGEGCAVFPAGESRGAALAPVTLAIAPSAAGAWPEGDDADLDPALERLAENDTLAGPGARAILIVHKGRLVAEHYTAGFDRERRQLGWSMTKSVTAGLVGL
jgi:hypothetical protein